MNVEELMREVVERNGSDGFLTARASPAVKVDGQIYSLETPALEEHEVRDLVLGTLSDAQKSDFLRTHECNYALQSEEYGRFRASAFVQRGNCGLVIRRIQTRIPRVDELNLPPIIEDLAMVKRGLVMFVGGTGTGKSTSLAAMVGHRNRNSRGHIVTVLGKEPKMPEPRWTQSGEAYKLTKHGKSYTPFADGVAPPAPKAAPKKWVPPAHLKPVPASPAAAKPAAAKKPSAAKKAPAKEELGGAKKRPRPAAGAMKA